MKIHKIANVDFDAQPPLEDQREQEAQKAFEQAELAEIKDFDGWERDGRFWSRRIYWEAENDQPSIAGSFGVEFQPDTAIVIDTWNQ